MISKKLENSLGILVLILAILLTNNGVWLCLLDINDPVSFCRHLSAGSEVQLLLFAGVLATGILLYKGMSGSSLFNEWKSHKVVVFFILYAIFSVLWTANLTGTVYHILILVFTTLLAFFLGKYFPANQWEAILLWFSIIIVSASFVLLIFFPRAAIMDFPHLGSWRGVFWHKNFTGSFMAFTGMIFLNLVISSTRKQMGRLIGGVLLYIMSLVFTMYSLSAAGVVILFILTGFELTLFLWSKVKNRLGVFHYYALGGTALALILIGITNMEILFRLINRSPDLTGRTFLWSYLIKSAVLPHPLIGQGFGAVWTLKDFIQTVTVSQGWGFPITNGHSGYMDTLLNLGGIGLLLLIIILVSAFQKTIKYFIQNSKPENMLPFLVVLYVFLANLSISFFQEIESFHWMILISTLLITTKDGPPQETTEV
jgi:exopolysaccharide production protein ExoQ